MTITTYAELQAEVGGFLNRQDLTAQIPTFIQMAEASMNRRLRHWRMEKRSTAPLDAQYTEIPLDWRSTIRFNVSGASEVSKLTLIGHADMDERRYQSNEAGRPFYYAMVAGDFELYPTPDDTYTADLAYIATIPPLADNPDGNWLLAQAPDAYLYGALTHTAPYLHEDARLQTWGGLYADAIAGLNAESDAAKHSGSGLKLRMP